jgi:hypothetical protein
MSNQSATESASGLDDTVSWDAMLAPIRQNWRIGVAFMTLLALMFVLIAVLSPRIYEAQVVAAFASPPDAKAGLTGIPSLGTIGSMLSGMASDHDQMYERLEYLQSYDVSTGFLRHIGAAPVLFARDYDPASSTWKERAPTEQELFRRFTEKVRRVEIDPKTGLLHVRVRLQDRSLVAKWADQYVAYVDRLYRDRALTEAEARRRFLESELAKAQEVSLKGTLADLIKVEIHKQMMAQTGTYYAFRIVSPAYTPDENEYVSPRLVLIGAVFLVVGAFLSVLLTVLWSNLRHGRNR